MSANLFDRGSVRPRQKLAAREATRIVAYRDGYCRLIGLCETRQQQKTEQDQSAHNGAGTLTQRMSNLG
jgi:hypothetical protein